MNLLTVSRLRQYTVKLLTVSHLTQYTVNLLTVSSETIHSELTDCLSSETIHSAPTVSCLPLSCSTVNMSDPICYVILFYSRLICVLFVVCVCYVSVVYCVSVVCCLLCVLLSIVCLLVCTSVYTHASVPNICLLFQDFTMMHCGVYIAYYPDTLFPQFYMLFLLIGSIHLIDKKTIMLISNLQVKMYFCH